MNRLQLLLQDHRNLILTWLLDRRLRMVEFTICLVSSHLDFNETLYNKLREKEMRLALRLAGIRKVELPDIHKPQSAKRTELRVVKS